MADTRSLASEQYAFHQLGLEKPLVSEQQLISRFDGTRVPEGIFAHPRDGSMRVSVEVKRIIGGKLPSGGGGRRVIRRRCKGGDHIIWPWTSSVEAAFSKLHDDIADEFRVSEHHTVFLIPMSIDAKTWTRTVRHIHDIAAHYTKTHSLSRPVIMHILRCDDIMFDRL